MGDPYFNDVFLLLHMDGSDGSTTFTDSSSNSLTVTANGDAQIDTAKSKFGWASLLLDGSGGYLDASGTQIIDATGSYTIECWIYHPSASNANNKFIYTTRNTAGHDGVSFYITDLTDKLRVLAYSSAGGLVHPSPALDESNCPTVPADQWVHVAVTFDGTTFRLFVDGVLGASGDKTYNTAGNSTRSFIGLPREGGAASGAAWIDDLRITNGVARYTSNFTPPTEELPNSSGASDTTVELALASEAELALPLGVPEIVALGAPSDTETAFDIGVAAAVSVPVVTEAESVSTMAFDFETRRFLGLPVSSDHSIDVFPLYPPTFKLKVVRQSGQTLAFDTE